MPRRERKIPSREKLVLWCYDMIGNNPGRSIASINGLAMAVDVKF